MIMSFQVALIISNLDFNNSTGSDGLRPSLQKLLRQFIFNSFSQTLRPSELLNYSRQGVVTPINKKRPRINVSIYQPN